MRVLYKQTRKVIKIAKNHIKVIEMAVQGTDAIPPDTYANHVANRNNPHEVGLFQLLVPTNSAGKWIKISDDGTALVATKAPLTEMPVLPQPVDEKVKADPGDPNSGYLSEKIAGVIIADLTNHVIKLLGVTSDSYPANYYYGTNDSGQIGFWKLPTSLVQVCGITKENEDEWLNTGEVELYEMP